MAVRAINGKTIEVEFNRQMKPATASAVSVKQTGSASALSGTNSLSLDKKTVTVALAASMVNKTGYDVVVDAGTAETLDGLKLSANYVYTFQFNDVVKPTVKNIEVKESGAVEVEFSEALGVAPQFVVNGGAKHTGTIVGTAPSSKYTLTLPAGVKTGDTLNIIVSDAADLAAPTANVMNIYTTSIVYTYTVQAPVVTKLAADDERTIELEFSKLVVSIAAGTEVKVYLGNDALVATTDYTLDGSENPEFTINFTNAGLAKLYANNATTATVKVAVEGYKDTLTPANMGVKVEQNIVMNKDTAKPAIKGAVTYVGTTITANLSEKVAATTALHNSIYVLGVTTGVKYPVTVGAASASNLTIAAQLTAGAEKIEIKNGDGTTAALPNGSYNLVIEAEALTDQNYGANKNDKITAPFTVGPASPTVLKPTVASLPVYSAGSTSEIKVTYTTAPVGISATNPANYKLGGVALPSATVITLDSAQAVATITLPEGTFATTENKVLSISGVTSTTGGLMIPYEAVFEVKDNTKPVLQTAVVDADGKILVTFSENIHTDAGVTAPVASDFKVVLNGTVVSDLSLTNVTTDKKQVTLSSSLSFSTASTLTVELVASPGIKDAAGNAVVLGTKITIK